MRRLATGLVGLQQAHTMQRLVICVWVGVRRRAGFGAFAPAIAALSDSWGCLAGCLGWLTTGAHNTAIGYEAGAITTGAHNAAIGISSLSRGAMTAVALA